MSQSANLNAYLFSGQPHSLSAALQSWLEESPRFVEFAETYRDKIRKKIRLAADPESALDLQAELAVAAGLLADRRFSLAYEPYASTGRRGPDFAVTFRGNTVFNLEVARLHLPALRNSGDDLPRPEERILRTLLEKLGQMQPGMANLLVIHVPAGYISSLDLDALMRDVKSRVEACDPAFLAAIRYSSPAAFFKDFLRLTALWFWARSTPLWVNKSAHSPLDEKILRLLSSMPQ